MATITTDITIMGVPTKVIQGWDPVLRRFFFVVEKETDEDRPFWSNLDNNISEVEYQSLEYFQNVAKKLNIYELIPVSRWCFMESSKSRNW